jgi:3-deoxy-7-phosphoheptulonate synthase
MNHEDLLQGRYIVLDIDSDTQSIPAMGALRFQVEDTGRAHFAFCDLGHRRLRPSEFQELDALPFVKRVLLQDYPWILAGRVWQPQNTIITSQGWELGASTCQVIAGPCSVENRDQMMQVAEHARKAGACWLRGGAFKPRSNPYHFQGLGEHGLKLLREAADANGMAVVTEVMSLEDVPLVLEYSDVLQVGSRNAQHFPLLKRLGRSDKPVLLKRGFGCTVNESVLAAEYVMSHGNPNVALCERGIRTFEPATRFTFDLNAVPLVKRDSHLPVVADPAHGTGDASLVEAVARGALAAGADALMFEIHPQPEKSRSDRDQTLSLEEFAAIMLRLKPLVEALGKSMPSAKA